MTKFHHMPCKNCGTWLRREFFRKGPIYWRMFIYKCPECGHAGSYRGSDVCRMQVAIENVTGDLIARGNEDVRALVGQVMEEQCVNTKSK